MKNFTLPFLALLFFTGALSAQPVVSFTVSDSIVCPRDTVFFTNTTTGGINYSWDFGDFTQTASTINAAHSYCCPGSYTVKLIAWDAGGLPDTTYKIIIVKNNPSPGFTVYKSNICPGEPLPISNHATGTSGVDSIRWYFGDGNTSSSKAAKIWHVYNLPLGVKIIRQNVYSDGCSDSASFNVNVVSNKPLLGITANATISDTLACPGKKIMFNLNDPDSSVKSVVWRFGNGDSSNKEITPYAFAGIGNYTITLIARNYCNQSDSVKRLVYIKDTIRTYLQPGDFGFPDPANVSSPLLDSISACPGDPVEFDFRSFNYAGVTTKWEFGDGTFDTLARVSHIYPTPGLRTARLIITNLCGNTDTGFVKVNVSNTVAAYLNPYDLWISDTMVCRGAEIDFNLFNTNGKYKSILWKFGDGQVSFGTHSVHSYSLTGIYNGLVRITNGCGRADSAFIRIQVSDTLKPMLNPGDYGVYNNQPPHQPLDTICRGKTVYFKFNHFFFKQHSVMWYFGDGDSSSLAEVPHSYANNGSYTAKIIVTNLCGKKDTGYIHITVTDTLSPKASIHVSRRDTVCFGDNIYFTGYGGDTYTWDYGDGSAVQKGQEVSHSYASPGTYTVSLMLSNTCGKTAMAKAQVYISNGGRPKFDITANRDVVCPGDTIKFACSEGTFTSYYWNFGDGSSSNQKNPVHVYNTTGNFYVFLVATNACGMSDTVYYNGEFPYIKISNSLEVEAEFMFTLGCAFTPIKFINNSHNKFSFHAPGEGIVSCNWDFGDGSTSTLKHPVHVYKAPGNYPVRLIVTNTCGNKDTLIKTIMIVPPARISGKVSYSGGLITKGKIYAIGRDSLPGRDTILRSTAIINGSYTIDSIPQGKYILRAKADSILYPDVVGTYADSAFFWDSARVVVAVCNAVTTVDIKMLEKKPLNQPGTLLRGYVGQDPGYGSVKYGGNRIMVPGDPIPDLDVKLGKQPKGEFYSSTKTNYNPSDSSFNYEFANVPYGTYIIYVDIPGLGLVGHHEITLSPGNTTIVKLDYWVDSVKIDTVKNNNLFIKKSPAVHKHNASVYPNPSKEQMWLRLDLDRSADVKVEVYNIIGEKVYSIIRPGLAAGEHNLPLKRSDVKGLSGVYLLRCTAGDKVYNERIIFTE